MLEILLFMCKVHIGPNTPMAKVIKYISRENP